MRKIYHSISFSLLLMMLASLSLYGQSQFPIQFRSGDLILQANTIAPNQRQSEFSEAFFENYYHALIQFEALPDAELRTLMKAEGIILKQYIPKYAYTALVASNVTQATLERYGVHAIEPFPLEAKLSPDFSGGQIPPHAQKEAGKVDIWLSLFDKYEYRSLMPALGNLGIEVLYESIDLGYLIVRAKQEDLFEIAALPFVLYVEPMHPEPKEENYPGRNNHRSLTLANSPFGLEGEGIKIGVWDGGEIDTHLDFTGRLNIIETGGVSGHATHVAGTVGGAGLLVPFATGMAPKSLLYSYDFFGNVVTEINQAVNNHSIVISQHSWGGGPSCATGDPYTGLSAGLDNLVQIHPHLVHVFSAGNSAASCPGGWRSTTNKAAKSTITVAALNVNDGLAAFSSRGPTQDGRVKPEISAMGVNVFSTNPGNNYANNSGTSMAAPGVSGTVAQLYERYLQISGGVKPPASLIKALVCNGADDLGNPHVDYRHGFGRINAWKAMQAMNASNFEIDSVATGDTNDITITVPAGASELKVFLCWSDVPATVGANPSLVNDLDLKVIDPAATTWLPWVLDPANPNNNATRQVDGVNVFEQVTIDNPVAGSYTLRVSGETVGGSPNQVYSLTWTVDVPYLQVTFPNGGEQLETNTIYAVHWDGSGINTAQTVEYSLDNGATWVTIGSVAAGLRRINWTTPNTITSQALIRVTAGALSDTSDDNFSIIAAASNLNATNTDCGSVDLSWTASTGATDYDVFLLDMTTGEYNLIGNTTTTNFTHSPAPVGTNWYSVRAKHAPTDTESERAVATSVEVTETSGDIAMIAIESPNCPFTIPSNETLSIRLSNEGCNDLPIGTTIPVSYSIDGGATINENIVLTANWTSGTEIIYDFTTLVSLTAPGSYNFVATVNFDGDIITENNEATLNLSGPDDLALTQIIAPNCPLLPSLGEVVSVEILNNGCADLPVGTNITMEYSLDGGAVVSETLTLAAALATGATTIYDFTTPLAIPTGESFDLEASIVFATDGDPSNNQINKVIYPGSRTLPYFQDFELPAPEAPCWTEQNFGTGPGWFFRTGPTGGAFVVPDPGSRYMLVNDDACPNPGCGDPSDDWMISPQLDFSSCNDIELNLDAVYRSGAAGGAFENQAFIKVSTDLTTWTTVYTFTSNAATWQNITVDLSAFAGNPEVWVAIHFDDLGNWGYGLAIDNFHIYELPMTSTALSPLHTATDVPTGTNIDITFSSQPVLQAGGTIAITGGTAPINITLPNPQVSVDGDILTINLDTDLESLTTYQVSLSPNAVKSLCGAEFAGITADTWSFTTEENPVTLNCPANITTSTAAGTCGETLTFATPTASGGTLPYTITQTAGLASGDVFPVGITTQTFEVTDDAGNTATCSFTVTVQDNEIPTITCPAGIVADTDAGVCEANVTIAVPTTADNCGVASVVNDFTGTDNASAVYPLGTTTVTYTVTDNYGNTSSCSFTVTVQDNEIPTITCPADIIVDTDAGVCEANVIVPLPTVTDNCTVVGDLVVTNDRTAVADASDTYPLGTTTVTYTVTDNAGNTATCSFDVTVEDNENPTITAPSDITTSPDAGSCDATGVVLGTPTAADNCAVASVTNDAPAAFSAGTTTVTWTVTDNAGNTATATQNVTVTDDEDPTAVCQNFTLVLDADGNGTLAPADINDGSNDNCTAAGDLIFSVSQTDFDCSDVGINTVTLTVEDAAGNTSSCTATVTVQDNTVPNAICQNLTITLDGTGSASITPADVDNGSNDACGIASLSLNMTDFDCSNVGANTVTLTVEDNNGNTATCTATITVEDNTAPSLTCPGTQTVADEDYTLADYTGLATATDNCGTLTLTQSPAAGTLQSGTTAVTITADDGNGNTIDCTFNVEVDATPPTGGGGGGGGGATPTDVEPVTNFTAVAQNTTSILLNWRASANAERYALYRQAQGSSEWVRVSTFSAGVREFLDTNLESDTR
ncbi:MAG: HYR domain-containing protein, partial [Bernardetiaceae bacterium]|nr:HYR domain-containing protein [Bernardetiaceae bacterium]